jgi:hypothetical protein
VVAHEYGQDTANVLGGVAQTARNVKGMGGDFVKSTSGVSHMVSAAVGFASVPTPNSNNAVVGDSRSESEPGTGAVLPHRQQPESSTTTSSHNESDVTETSLEGIHEPLETIPL